MQPVQHYAAYSILKPCCVEVKPDVDPGLDRLSTRRRRASTIPAAGAPQNHT